MTVDDGQLAFEFCDDNDGQVANCEGGDGQFRVVTVDDGQLAF